MQSNKKLPINFRSWEMYTHPSVPSCTDWTWSIRSCAATERPLFVLAVFQTAKKDDFSKDASEFDHVNVTSAKLFLNSEFYPAENNHFDFDKKKFSLAYRDFCNFQRSYFHEDAETQLIMPTTFLERYPVLVFDSSVGEEILRISPIDIRINFTFEKNVPANTSVYAIIITERSFAYSPFTGLVEKII